MKEVNVECLKCHYFENAPDSSGHFDALLDLEKCPECGAVLWQKKKIIELI